MANNDDYFEIAFEKLCELEGFLSDVKGDLGGRTIYGISERYFPKDVEAMLNLSQNEAKQYAMNFYKTRFWDPVSKYQFPLNLVAFLMAVNAPGPIKNAINQYDDYRDVLLYMCKYYSGLVQVNPNLIKFFRGWINRVISVWEFVGQMEKGNNA